MMESERQCLAKLIPHLGGLFSCNNCDGLCDEKPCYHNTPWDCEEEEAKKKKDQMYAALEVLKRVHDFLGEVIRDSLMEDTPRASDLADDVWDVLHWDEKVGETK